MEFTKSHLILGLKKLERTCTKQERVLWHK